MSFFSARFRNSSTEYDFSAFNLVIDFIHDCAHAYYWQQQQNKTDSSVIQPFPLVEVNLECNLLTVDSDAILQRYIDTLQEQKGFTTNLTISISGNIIKINVPNPFQEMQMYEWRYSFFVTKHLEKRQSIMQPDKYLTPEMGFVYLVCAKKPEDKWGIYFGHAAIYIERLNLRGQLELEKFELFGGASAASATASASTAPGKGKVNPEALDAMRLMRGRNKLDFQAWPVKSYLIQQLVDKINTSPTTDAVKYSSLGISGENCTTWAIEKLKSIGLEVDETIFPTKAAGGGCVVM